MIPVREQKILSAPKQARRRAESNFRIRQSCGEQKEKQGIPRAKFQRGSSVWRSENTALNTTSLMPEWEA